MLELREEEVGHDPTDTGGTTPDETTLAGNVPSRGVKELRGEVDHGDLSNVVGSTTNGGAKSTKSDSGCLGNDGVRDGSECPGEDKRDQYAEDGLGVVGSAALADASADTEKHKQDDVGDCAPEVDSTAAEPASERPGEDVGKELEARVDEVEVESTVIGHASL